MKGARRAWLLRARCIRSPPPLRRLSFRLAASRASHERASSCPPFSATARPLHSYSSSSSSCCRTCAHPGCHVSSRACAPPPVPQLASVQARRRPLMLPPRFSAARAARGSRAAPVPPAAAHPRLSPAPAPPEPRPAPARSRACPRSAAPARATPGPRPSAARQRLRCARTHLRRSRRRPALAPAAAALAEPRQGRKQGERKKRSTWMELPPVHKFGKLQGPFCKA
ncbi:hypothetical protein GQ55_8G169100 [Panicum hallii var. hallii]|uniref:Uncharacterized protein n=1 Tax=Panicum hallii var. hallii TaxID=1504633 RepID=A0A2T7CNJ0_9POAL|nr:hypothetical protein GQ55_8G169100 [Panicum hallii var. hallii]